MRGCSVLLALVASTSCDRTEEPRSSQPRPLASTPGAGVAVPAPVERERCMVPLPSEPPPPAQPAQRCPPDPEAAPRPPLPVGTVSFVEAPGSPRIRVELAREPRARTRGLMYRTGLAENSGMLFSWPDEKIRSFWMRNTCIPLDMLFIANDGTIVGILEQVPTLSDTSRKIPCPATHVLETNAGWARQHGVRSGQKLQIDTRSPPKGPEP